MLIFMPLIPKFWLNGQRFSRAEFRLLFYRRMCQCLVLILSLFFHIKRILIRALEIIYLTLNQLQWDFRKYSKCYFVFKKNFCKKIKDKCHLCHQMLSFLFYFNFCNAFHIAFLINILCSQRIFFNHLLQQFIYSQINLSDIFYLFIWKKIDTRYTLDYDKNIMITT